MKIFPNHNISFQKQLVATCMIKGSKGQIPCSIYKIEDCDSDYFMSLTRQPGWKKYVYATIIDGDIKRGNAEDMYAIEDKNNNCLGYLEMISKNSEKNVLEFLEVKPVCRAKNEQRHKQYIGETLLNFLAQITRKSGKNALCVTHTEPSAVEFYNKCLFSNLNGTRSLILLKDDMEKLKEQNLNHTGSTINFIG